jgi:hypothetical protein
MIDFKSTYTLPSTPSASASASSESSTSSAQASTSSLTSSFAWERSRSSPLLAKQQLQRSSSARRHRDEAKREGSQLASGSHAIISVVGDTSSAEQPKSVAKPRGLSSLLSSTPLLLNILREEQEAEEEQQRSKTLSLPDALLLSPTASTSASQLSVSTPASCSSAPSTLSPDGPDSPPRSTSLLVPPVSPRKSAAQGCELPQALSELIACDEGGQHSQQPDTLFNARDLKLFRNKDIVCLVQVLTSLAALKAKPPSTRAARESDDENDYALMTEQDRHAVPCRRHHGKDLTASEEAQRVTVQLHQPATQYQRSSSADDADDDLSLDFGRMCSIYTEAAVRALLRYYAESIVELVFPDNPHVCHHDARPTSPIAAVV